MSSSTSILVMVCLCICMSRYLASSWNDALKWGTSVAWKHVYDAHKFRNKCPACRCSISLHVTSRSQLLSLANRLDSLGLDVVRPFLKFKISMKTMKKWSNSISMLAVFEWAKQQTKSGERKKNNKIVCRKCVYFRVMFLFILQYCRLVRRACSINKIVSIENPFRFAISFFFTSHDEPWLAEPPHTRETNTSREKKQHLSSQYCILYCILDTRMSVRSKIKSRAFSAALFSTIAFSLTHCMLSFARAYTHTQTPAHWMDWI